MVTPQELLQDTVLDNDFDVERLSMHESTGFIQVDEAQVASGGMRLIGFGVPLSSEGGMDMSRVVVPLTRFDELSPGHRTIDEQGKGVGPRMYNTRQAIGGSRGRPEAVGVYTFDMHPAQLLDARASQGGTLSQYARHAARMVAARIHGVERVVDTIHESYRDAAAVELTMPPNPQRRQARRGIGNLVVPQMIIIRSPDIALHRVGMTTAPWED